MCTVVLGLDAHPRAPLIIAANRDEWLARPTAPFGQLSDPTSKTPAIFGGRDLKAGGTWFGARSDGTMAMLANIRPGGVSDAKKKSRGELVLSILGAEDLVAMRKLADKIDAAQYNPFNLLFGQGTEWYHVRGEPPFGVTKIAPGLHVLGNLTLDSADDRKTEFVHKELAELKTIPSESLAERLSALLEDPTLCTDAGPYGTRWSMVYLGGSGAEYALGIAEAGIHAGPLKKVRIPK